MPHKRHKRGREDRAIRAGCQRRCHLSQASKNMVSDGGTKHGSQRPQLDEQRQKECRPLSHPHWPKRRIWESYTIVGSMSGKVTLGRTLKLTLLCGVVKRKGLGVGRREVTRRQSKDQGFRLGAKDWAKVREGKCLFTRGINGKHILIEIRCLKSGQLPKGSW